MKPRTTTRLALACVLVLAACGKARSPEELVNERLAVTQDFGEILAKVTDKTTAERHLDQVMELVKKSNKWRREFKQLSDEDKQTCEALSKEIEAELRVADGAMRSELLRIKQNEEVQRVLGLWLARI